MDVTLYIENENESKVVRLDEELSIGRTDLAQLALDDPGLSRINTTFFVEGDEILITDENSTNGTFLNGQNVSGRPKTLSNGDEIRIGTHTKIRVEILTGRESEPPAVAGGLRKSSECRVPGSGLRTNSDSKLGTLNSEIIFQPPATAGGSDTDGPPVVLIAAVAMTVAIIFFGGLAYWIVSGNEKTSPGRPKTPPILSTSLIPVRVIDPLGGEDEEDLDDLIASWETQEEAIKAEDVADISVMSPDAEEAELSVTSAFLADRQRKAFEDRPGEKGVRPAGLAVPKELFGDGVIKQKTKLRSMNTTGYRQPMDFAELAEKRMKRELIEMPMAAESFYLDVGGSAQDRPFSSFDFTGGIADILPGTPKYQILSKLAGDFAGQKYDLNNPGDRKQMRMRLLRMFNQRARPILKELAEAYYRQFKRPLRVTSLTRSMDYQILLNASNANSFKVRGEGSLPPHTSGCAFDLSRKHMPVEEQNFVMKKLAEMESQGRLDALIEYGTNACFHVFIYDDGNPPKM